MTAEISLHKTDHKIEVPLEIQVQRKAIWGNKYFYPLNNSAHMILSLMKKKSFTFEQLKYMRSCGCEVRIIVEEECWDD